VVNVVLVKNVMSKPVVTVEPKSTVVNAAGQMKDAKIGCLIVVDPQEKPLGIVTESDFIYKVLAEKMSLDTSVSDVMSKDIKTIKEDESIDQAARVMAAHRIRRLPVVGGKKLVGIVTLKDVVKAKRVNNESDYYPYFT
jgi:CBS domain-containing protein